MDFEEKQERKRERYRALAEKNTTKSNQAYETQKRMRDLIPFGQPILVGHHSERGHRNALDRIDNLMRRSIDASKKADYYENKAERIGTGGISSDDPEAIQKLEAKLEAMETKWVEIKQTRKEGRDVFAWGVFTANIRSIKKRIEELKKRQQVEARPDVVGSDWILKEDKEENRIMFVFDHIPEKEKRDRLKSLGFRWTPSRKAWTRMLNGQGRHAASRFIESH